MDEREASEALAALRQTRTRLAGRARWPFARHAVVGLITGALIAGSALPAPWWVAVELLCCLCVALVVAWDRRRDGFFVNGYRAGRTRAIAIGSACFAMAALVAALVAQGHGWGWAPLASGLLAAIVTTWASFAWERAYRRELEEPRP